MKRIVIFALSFLFLSATAAFAASGDLVLTSGSVRFSPANFLEGKTIRIYAVVDSASPDDLKGVVKFFDNKEQIAGDQPVSVLAGREDAVFVDWKAQSGDHTIRITLVPFDNNGDNPNNNSWEKTITVLADTDRDGIPNITDPDDDNDGVPDESDAFPLDRTESIDSDGDTLGNNKDDDDDNDGVKDTEDALPLNANETLDTDHDGIGDNEDADDDGDGIPDADEIKFKTDPLKADTDGDGVPDKQDAFPVDATQAHDFDKDGISDARDNDADNDGIPKSLDINDTNLGPKIKVTTKKKRVKRLILANETVHFETTTSVDPDGSITKTEWRINGKPTSEKAEFETKFEKTGFHMITALVTDDKNESREETFRVFVATPLVIWTGITLILLIFILAIFLIFFYSKRRVSRFEDLQRTLDIILKFLPKPKKK